MPNIEIRGFSTVKANALKKKIDQVMRGLDLGDEAMTSIAKMRTESCNKKKTPMPYIRVCSTSSVEIDRIIVALREANLNVDTEWLKLSGFHPAKEMRR